MFIAKLKDKLIGFLAVLTHPHRKPLKRIHRLVILPEFQSLGIGTRLLNEVGKKYRQVGWDVTIRTSNRGLIHSLQKNMDWKVIEKGHKTSWNRKGHSLNKTFSIQRYTVAFKMM